MALKVRQDQMDYMAEARWRDFRTRAVSHVRETRPGATNGMSDGALDRLFDSSATRAHRFNLRSEHEILYMFEATLLLGDQFEKRPEHDWALEVLNSRYLGPEQRAALLLAHADHISAPNV